RKERVCSPDLVRSGLRTLVGASLAALPPAAARGLSRTRSRTRQERPLQAARRAASVECPAPGRVSGIEERGLRHSAEVVRRLLPYTAAPRGMVWVPIRSGLTQRS